jgi:hypothetical protein
MAQSEKVEIRSFSVDGTDIDCKLNIEVNVDGRIFKPTFVDNSFNVPKEVHKAKKVGIRLRCGQYQVRFKSLNRSDFAYNGTRFGWRVGIDRYPFEDADVPSELEDKVEEVHYISFQPDGYVTTRVQVLIPNKRSKKK